MYMNKDCLVLDIKIVGFEKHCQKAILLPGTFDVRWMKISIEKFVMHYTLIGDFQSKYPNFQSCIYLLNGVFTITLKTS